MNVDTKKSSTQVVMMRLLGELAVKAGATDLPLWVGGLISIRRRRKAGYRLTSRPPPLPRQA